MEAIQNWDAYEYRSAVGSSSFLAYPSTVLVAAKDMWIKAQDCGERVRVLKRLESQQPI
jgi:hypothetical protein